MCISDPERFFSTINEDEQYTCDIFDNQYTKTTYRSTGIEIRDGGKKIVFFSDGDEPVAKIVCRNGTWSSLAGPVKITQPMGQSILCLPINH